MIKVNNRYIGKDHPTFIAAEVGINHNGSLELAKKCIDAVKRSGADAVKFQNYVTEDFILDKSLKYSYYNKGCLITESQYDMFKRCELSFAQLKELKEYCDTLDLCFFSTPTGESGLDDLVRLNTGLIKNGSDFLVNLPLIAKMAKTKIPTIISTGMATLSEMDEAVRFFEASGGKELIILHCVSSYPAPMSSVNLNKIDSMKKAFNYPIGFSDHTDGVIAAIGAVIKGACFIEKHFTIDKTMEGPDHYFSCDEEELKYLVKSIREVELALGTSKLGPVSDEIKSRIEFRLSCVASRDLNEGDVITSKDIYFSRPATGIPPKLAHLIQGKTLGLSMKRGEAFKFENLIKNV